MRRTVLAIVGLLLASLCPAEPQFWKLFSEHYQPVQGTAIEQAQCVTCHVGKGSTVRNDYGKTLEKLVNASQDRKLSVPMLQQVEKQDSDGDGASNIDEIRAGTLPGDPASKPGAPSSVGGNAGGLIPAHSFHPLFVHFPIGIFIFGALLDMWGRRKRSVAVREAARFGIITGALFTILAVASGLLAMFRMEKAIEGNMLWHLILGVASCLIALGMAAWRRRGEPDSLAYWTSLTISVVVLAVAGHLGSTMVWG